MSLRRRAVLLSLGISAVGAAAFAAPPGARAAAVTEAAGMTDSLMLSIPAPTSIAQLGNGSMVVATKGGVLAMLDANGLEAAAPVLTLADVCTDSERGLLGVAGDPAFGANGFIYLYATRMVGGTCVNRVSRFTMTGVTASLASEKVLIDRIPSPAGNHNGGDVKFGQDGLLYVTVGDGGCAVFDRSKCAGANPAAQRSDTLSGKILRINADGSIPDGNMFGPGAVACSGSSTGLSAGGAPCAEIYATGLRNPYRLVPDLVAGGNRFLTNDVGQNAQEEVDELTVGGNYGWNSWEGVCPTGQKAPCSAAIAPAGFIPPVYAYNQTTIASGRCSAITGGALPPDGWTGKPGRSYLYADLGCDTIFEVQDLGGANVVTSFATGVGPVVDMQMVHEAGGWALWYATFANDGEVRRLRPSTNLGVRGPGRFVARTPIRVLDTRNGIGSNQGKPIAGSITTFRLPTSVVPAEATAVAVNITGVAPSGPGFVTAWPAWSAKPGVSNVNFAFGGETSANAAVLPVAPGGEINVSSSTGAHLLVDLTGYWLPASTATGGRFTAVSPNRILDTRNGIGAPTGQVAARGRVDLQVTGRGGVPSSGVSAIALVVTSVAAVSPGFVTVWPSDKSLPDASSLNPSGGDVRANLVIVPVSPVGKVSLYTWSATDLLADVAGWFTDDSAPSSGTGLLQMVPPTRLLDTRQGIAGGGAFPTRATIPVPVASSGSTSAGVYNLTAASTGSWGFLTVYPFGQSVPDASNVNFERAGQNRAALAITAVSTAQPVANLFTYGSTHIIVDAQAYFT